MIVCEPGEWGVSINTGIVHDSLPVFLRPFMKNNPLSIVPKNELGIDLGLDLISYACVNRYPPLTGLTHDH